MWLLAWSCLHLHAWHFPLAPYQDLLGKQELSGPCQGMGSGTAWCWCLSLEQLLRVVPSPLHLTWSCLPPEKWQNWSFFSHLEALLASMQQSGAEGGIHSAMVDTKTFGGYAWKQWSRQPSVLTKSIWMSAQVLAAVWFSTWALLNCNSFCGAPLTLPFLFAHGPYLHGLLGSPGWQTVPQSRLWCFADLFPPVFISEGHNFSLVTCPEKCSPLSRSLIFLDGWFVKQMQSKLSPFFPVACLGLTLPWVSFNRPPVFSIRQVSCLMCTISVHLWCHNILCSKKQELNKCHINWTDFSEFLALFRELTYM